MAFGLVKKSTDVAFGLNVGRHGVKLSQGIGSQISRTCRVLRMNRIKCKSGSRSYRPLCARDIIWLSCTGWSEEYDRNVEKRIVISI